MPIANAARLYLGAARAAVTLLGLLSVIVGLLGMHVLAGAHASGGSGHAAAGGTQLHSTMAAQHPAAVHSSPAVHPAEAGHNHRAVSVRACAGATDQMSMADACTLDRPQPSVDGVVVLPSQPATQLAADALFRPAFFRGSSSGADPPSLTLLGISRT